MEGLPDPMTAWLCLLPRGRNRAIRSRSRQSTGPLPPPAYRDDIIVTPRSLPDDAGLLPIRSYAPSRRPAAPCRGGRSVGGFAVVALGQFAELLDVPRLPIPGNE